MNSATKQSLAIILSTLLLLFDSGCHVNKVSKVEVSKVPKPQQEHIVGVTTKAGQEVAFDAPGGTISQNLIQANVKQKPYSIALADVQRLWIERREVSSTRTVGLTVAIAAVATGIVIGVIAATKQSCPFVYSWDGKQYVFDAEPYGGAITKAMERDDYSEMPHLREQNGVYRVMLTNEVDETQYTNSMELWVTDHAPGLRVVADENGNLYGFREIQGLQAARDRYGNDLLSWLRSTDRKIWEPDAIAGPDGNLRQEIVLTFAKPEGATRANLIANAATGLWGSYMIKKMVELHGRESANWLAAVDKDPVSIQNIHAWGEREGTYRLPIEVEEPGGWGVRGTLPNGGPLIAQDRVISLDVTHVRGTELRIRLRPPVGFWAFNSFAVAYGAGEPIAALRVGARSAKTSDGRDIVEELKASDERYYAMPDGSKSAEITFAAPPTKAGMQRTIFLHTRGWYQLHLRETSPPDVATFNKIMTVPGAAAEFAVARFVEWRQVTLR